MMHGLWDFAVFTMRDPSAAQAQLNRMVLRRADLFMAAVLVAVMSALMAYTAAQLFPAVVETGLNGFTRNPLILALTQLGGIVMAAVLITSVGRAFGGQGRFDAALAMMIWIETILLAVQLAQVVLMLIFPLFASALSLVAVGVFIYLAVLMIRALHGFRSVAMVAFGMLGTMLAMGMVLSFIASALGLIEVPA